MNLGEYRYEDLFKDTHSEEEAYNWCLRTGLLPTVRICACGEVLMLRTRLERVSGFFLRCPRAACRAEYSVRCGTWFEGSHMSLCQIVRFLYFWVRDNVRQEEMMFQLGIRSEHTVVDWKKRCRYVCE